MDGRGTTLGPARANADRADANGEMERILSAAVRVMTTAAPDSPKVSDIVAEAGTCNKTFYRYFGGKDELVLAVMERGIARVAADLAARMDGTTDPAGKVASWVDGLLAQLSDPQLFSMCHATVAQFSTVAQRHEPDADVMRPLRVLLDAPLAAMGGRCPERDGDAVFHCTMGVLRSYLGSGRRPPQGDVEHLVRFCLGGVGVGLGDPALR
ncbi:TetR/AcrR family transcriptional regulator [Mycolicibacterium palauense]|uniref:TetR/AcrR family transcriptional regulator n=1 Tax=Mycolicibacterium palauense TaxID=2034511 RepID=UPI000BFEC8B6|nr:TetR/AcrR family transcriptional regulator [Mycolicibacterium palauense]